MLIRAQLYFLAIMAISTQSVLADEELNPLEPSAWAGFPNGTWIISSTKLYRGDELQSSVREKRIQIANPEKEDFFYEAYRERDGEFTHGPIYYGRAIFPGSSPEFHLKVTRNETIEIEGKKYPCHVKEFVYNGEDRDRRESAIYWCFKEELVPCREINQQGKEIVLPANALRMKYFRKDARREVSSVFQIASFQDKVEIKGHPIVCVREEGTIESREGAEKTSGKIQHWLSNDVPGHQVKEVSKGTVDGVKAERRKEIEDFYVPILKPGATKTPE